MRDSFEKTDTTTPAWPGDGSPDEIFRKASEAIEGDHPVHRALVVAWYSLDKNGSGTLRYLHTSSDGAGLTALLADLTFENHISRRSIFGDGREKVDVVYPIRKVDEQ